MSGVGAVPASRFTRPLPHTPLNHFLRTTKSLLASGGLDNEDIVYVVTSRSPTLDHAAAAIGFAYLQQRLDTSGHTQRRYVPVISAARKACLTDELPELALALQAVLISEENVIFEDDEVYKTVGAYTSKKKVVLVGGAAEQKGEEAWKEWLDLHGAELFGVIDTENTLPKQMHDEQGGVNERLNVALFPSAQAVRGGGEAEPSLASLVALWAKQQILASSTTTTTDIITRELADLLLGAILLETDNLSESQTNSADLGAVGWLNPRSSFQLQDEDEATSGPDVTTEDDDLNNDEMNAPNYDAFVPTFPDLDAMYRALRGASRRSLSAKDVSAVTADEGAKAVDLGDAPPQHYQWNLITNTLANLDEQQKASVPDFVRKTIVGDFAAVLTSSLASRLLKPIGTQLGQFLGSDGSAFDLVSVRKQIDSAVAAEVTSESQGFEALCVAVCALHAFVQINWTGPELPESLDLLSLLRASASDAFPPRPVDVDAEEKTNAEAKKLIHSASLEALAFKGEPAYHLCQVPFFLVFSKLIFESLWAVQASQQHESRVHIETLPWWRLRAFTVHSHVLDEPVAFGKKVFDPVNKLRDVLVARAAAATSTASEAGRSEWASLSSRLILERGIALQRLGSDKEASETFVDAAKENGLRYRMSGALGKRTKFQKEDKTQLVLLAKSVVADGGKEDEAVEKSDKEQGEAVEGAEKEEALETGFAAKANPEDQVAGMPSTYALNDDTLLEQTKFTSTTTSNLTSVDEEQADADLLQLNPNAQPALAVLDQCTLLALCLNIRNTQAAHGLTANQMQMFISRVITHPRNWMVHTMSLLLRARLESTRTRTVERSVLQLQALIDQMPTNDSSIQERLKFFHALDLPPRWEMQAELARRYASIGVTRSALEIFERVEMWEEVVQCLGMLGRQEEGVEVVRELLEGKKVEADVEVAVRRRRDARVEGSEAQRVMYGRMDRAREAKLWCLLGDLEPASALAHYSKAWQVSASSSARAARSLGGVHFTSQDFQQAAKWLRYALKINPLYTRSWFILGCCYMRLEKWKEAAQCFRRCTALDDEDMESWNNLASCYLRMVEGVETAVGIERMGEQGGLPDILEAAEEEADRVWDVAGDEEESEDEGLSDWSGSSRSDSGVEMSSDESDATSVADSDAETETGLPNPGEVSSGNRGRRAGATTSAYSLKLLAHRSLQQSLRFAHDNWRIWYNYMIVCIDVGYLLEATRAMVRVTEIQTRNKTNDAERAKTVDLAVLARLVDAVTRTPKAELEAETLAAQEAYEAALAEHSRSDSSTAAPTAPKLDPNSGLGLLPAVQRLFDETLLTRISTSSGIWKLYSRLLLWDGQRRRAIQHALLNAYNAALVEAEEGGLQSDKEVFTTLLKDLRNLVDGLLDLGEEREGDAPEPKFQARSLVRSFLAKTRDSWDQEDEWEEAKELLEQLKS
ncbi:Essential for maintenance of the cell wall protein 1 [Pseudozyma hubeiensis]|nr:Essential for maintenance of the cell wall protein 1 [Pseudozyma hubeiensis]